MGFGMTATKKIPHGWEKQMRRNNPWLDDPPPTLTSSTIIHPPPMPPRYPSTLKEERRCIQELQSRRANLSPNALLSNGMRVTDFALAYVMKHHLKRKADKSV